MVWDEIDYFLENYGEQINEKKILDIWCGNGRLLSHFMRSPHIYDIDYYGIDASKGMIEEAQKETGCNAFDVCDMTALDTYEKDNFGAVFFIASFHHLMSYEERSLVLEHLKTKIEKWSYVFFTNWALESEINWEKYKNNVIPNSENEWGGKDFSIKFGEYDRFYHSFTLQELEWLFLKSGFTIIENKIFENNRNFISILKY